MFKFGKRKSKSKKSQNDQEEKSELDELIHVMPDRFYVQPKKSRLGLVLVLVISFLIIVGLSVAGYFLNESLKRKRLIESQNIGQPVENPLVNNSNVNQNNDDEEEVNNNVNINSNVNVNVNTNTSQATSTDDIDLDPVDPDPVVGPVDADNDGLTNLEENLYGTNPNLNDSDGDSYYDGAEMLSGYDPTSPSLTLGASGLFGSYNHQNYSISYPRAWTVREQDDDNNEVLFISDVGEFIEVLVIPNIRNLTVEQWFVELLPNVEVTPDDYVTVNNAVGVRVDDGKTYYLIDSADNSRVFILTYNNGSSNIYNFETTFGIMTNSFRIIK